MGQPAAPVTARAALDRFFDGYYRLRPVTATFTGIHQYDDRLPDWSTEGLDRACAMMRACRDDLREAGRVDDVAVRRFPDDVDLALADGFLEIQIAEHEGTHFYSSNPALWTGEAVFSVLSLVTRDGAPLDQRVAAATARMQAIGGFFDAGRKTLTGAPAAWTAKALRECDAAAILFGSSLPAWFETCGVQASLAAKAVAAAESARDSFHAFAHWLSQSLPAAEHLYSLSATTPSLELLLQRGHWISEPIDVLLAEASAALDESSADAEIPRLEIIS